MERGKSGWERGWAASGLDTSGGAGDGEKLLDVASPVTVHLLDPSGVLLSSSSGGSGECLIHVCETYGNKKSVFR